MPGSRTETIRDGVMYVWQNSGDNMSWNDITTGINTRFPHRVSIANREIPTLGTTTYVPAVGSYIRCVALYSYNGEDQVNISNVVQVV